MADYQETPSDINGEVHQEKGAKIDEHADQVKDKNMESEEVQSGSESIEVTEGKSKESEKATGAEEKSPEPLSPLTSDTTSGIEVKSDPDTPPEDAASGSAKTSASSSERPSVSGTEGSSTSGIGDTSAMETESSPLAAPVETSPTKKSKTSSFTGAIRKIISPRKKDRSHEDEANSPKDKQKSKSFLRNPLTAGKSMSPPTKSMDVSSAPVVNEETPEANTSKISPTKEGAKGAVGGKTLSPSSTSPTRKSGNEGFGSKMTFSEEKIFLDFFKKTGPLRRCLAAAEGAAADAAASRHAQATEEESFTPPVPGKPRFLYWREGKLSLDEHPPSLCETEIKDSEVAAADAATSRASQPTEEASFAPPFSGKQRFLFWREGTLSLAEHPPSLCESQITDAQAECSKFSDAFIPDWEESCTTEGVGSCSDAVDFGILKTMHLIVDLETMAPQSGDVESLKPIETEEDADARDAAHAQANSDLALLENISTMLVRGRERDIPRAPIPGFKSNIPEEKRNKDEPDLPVTSDPDSKQNHFENSEVQDGESKEEESKAKDS